MFKALQLTKADTVMADRHPQCNSRGRVVVRVGN